jgi:hypothetical protein
LITIFMVGAQRLSQQAQAHNFPKSAKDSLDLAVSNHQPPTKVEDARIELAVALFALQRHPEALKEATAFTTECLGHKAYGTPTLPSVLSSWLCSIAMDDTSVHLEQDRQG